MPNLALRGRAFLSFLPDIPLQFAKADCLHMQAQAGGKERLWKVIVRAQYVELSREHEYLKSAGFLITAGKERHPL